MSLKYEPSDRQGEMRAVRGVGIRGPGEGGRFRDPPGPDIARLASHGARRENIAILGEQLFYRNVQRFRARLVFKAHRLVYHSTLGLRVIKKKNNNTGQK